MVFSKEAAVALITAYSLIGVFPSKHKIVADDDEPPHIQSDRKDLMLFNICEQLEVFFG